MVVTKGNLYLFNDSNSSVYVLAGDLIEALEKWERYQMEDVLGWRPEDEKECLSQPDEIFYITGEGVVI